MPQKKQKKRRRNEGIVSRYFTIFSVMKLQISLLLMSLIHVVSLINKLKPIHSSLTSPVSLRMSRTDSEISIKRSEALGNSESYDLAMFSMGCFWGPQKAFLAHHGVTQAWVGYSGGPDDTSPG